MRNLFVAIGLLGISMAGEWTTITMAQYDKLIEKAESFFVGAPCKVEYHMISYQSYDEKAPHDTQKGTAIMNGNNYYTDFLGIKTIQNKNYRITIDSVAQNISVGNAIDLTNYKPLLENFKIFKNYFKTVKLQTLSNGQTINIEFKEKLKVKKITIDLGADGFMKKSVTYSNTPVKTKEGQKVLPRIETIYSGYKKVKPEQYKVLFDEKNYFTIVNGKLNGVKKYKDFKINDTRIKK